MVCTGRVKQFGILKVNFGTLDGFELKTKADYLYFTAVDGEISIGMKNNGNVESIGFEYTSDPESGIWTDFTATNSVSDVQIMTTLKAGETVFIRAKALRTGLSKSYSDNWNFVFGGDSNGRVQAGGNIMSLLDPEVKSTTIGSYAFCRLFDAEGKQSRLLTSPEILATTIAEHCFERMFTCCSTLQEPPMMLPAMKLAVSCYEYMFNSCESLEYAPALPATHLAKECYYGMFNRCTSLKESPYLPAETLVESCYRNMFMDCSSLSRVSVNFTDFNSDLYATTSWLNGASNSGEFYCPMEVSDDFKRSESTIPEGWAAYRNTLPENAAIGTEVLSSGRLGIYVGTVNGHKLLVAKTDVGSDNELQPGIAFSLEESASQSWGQGWRLPTEAEMKFLYDNFTMNQSEDAAMFSINGTALYFPYTNDVADGNKESRSWLSGMESFFWFRSDSKCGRTEDSSAIKVHEYRVRLVKGL